jgi:hypothetical protein
MKPSISRRLLCMLALLALSPASAIAGMAEADPQEMVRRADSFRQIYPDALMNVRLTNYVGQERGRESLLKVAVNGSDKSLIQVVEGAELGQQMLTLDIGLWVKLPRSTRAVRITPMQRLLGEAAVGDIGRMLWQDDYVARLAEQGTPGTPGGTTKLELTAKSGLATYPRILLTVSTTDGYPVEATFFLKSGKPIKTVNFDKPAKMNDRLGIRRMVFKDLLKPENSTEMVVEQIVPKTIEPRLYAVETLGQWR